MDLYNIKDDEGLHERYTTTEIRKQIYIHRYLMKAYKQLVQIGQKILVYGGETTISEIKPEKR